MIYSKILKTYSKKNHYVIRAGIYKVHVKKANKEDPDQTASSEVCTVCLGFSDIELAFEILEHLQNVNWLPVVNFALFLLLFLLFSEILSISLCQTVYGLRRFIGSDLGPNCLQRLSADNI